MRSFYSSSLRSGNLPEITNAINRMRCVYPGRAQQHIQYVDSKNKIIFRMNKRTLFVLDINFVKLCAVEFSFIEW